MLEDECESDIKNSLKHESEKEELNEQIEKLSRENNTLRFGLEQSFHFLRDLNESLDQTTQQLNECSDKLSEERLLTASLKAQAISTNHQLQQKNKDFIDLTIRHSQMAQENLGLRSRLDETKKKLSRSHSSKEPNKCKFFTPIRFLRNKHVPRHFETVNFDETSQTKSLQRTIVKKDSQILRFKNKCDDIERELLKLQKIVKRGPFQDLSHTQSVLKQKALLEKDNQALKATCSMLTAQLKALKGYPKTEIAPPRCRIPNPFVLISRSRDRLETFPGGPPPLTVLARRATLGSTRGTD